MPIIEGSVTSVKELPPKDGKDPLTSVSVEGISMLAKPGVAVPSAGAFVRCKASTYWPKGGGRPVLFLQAFSPAQV